MTKLRVLAVLSVLSMLAIACRSGSEGKDTESTGTGHTQTTQSAQGGPEKFGTLASPCGKGDASGATDQGVTDTDISVGTMSDATAELQPGLNQELWDASRAFVAWCNGQGGINGRKIKYTEYGAKLFEAKQRTIEACDKEFMLVGGGAAFDNDVVGPREACGLPDVPAYNATIQAIEGKLTYPPVPTPFDKLPAGEAFYLEKQHPDAVKKAGMLAPNFPSAINIATRARLAYTGAGWKFVKQQLYNPAGEANWTSIVTGYRSAGVDALVYVGTYEPLVAFLQAAAEQSWKPSILIGSSTIFTDDLIKEAGAAADGAYTYTNIAPYNETPSGSAIAKYVELLKTYAKGAKPALLGENSMSAWLLWAGAVKACGSKVTRDCVTSEIAKVHSWTAGGLQAASDPAKEKPAPCFVLVQVKGDSWTRVHPDKGYDCDPSYVVPTAGNYE
jgi:ABC-type branched-subunit amino acid transport system substrate-binding protein